MKSPAVTRAIVLSGLLLAMISPRGQLLAQTGETTPVVGPTNTVPALQRLQAESEGTWTALTNKRTGLPRMLFGAKSKAYGAKPERAAQAFMQEHRQLFLPETTGQSGLTAPELKLHSVKADMPGSAVVEFREEYQGIPVYGAAVTVMVDAQGRINHLSSTADPRVRVPAQPALDFERANASFLAGQPAERFVVKENKLVIYPGPVPRFAYQVIYERGAASEPWEYLLNADTGEVLKATRLVKDMKKNVTAVGSGGQ